MENLISNWVIIIGGFIMWTKEDWKQYAKEYYQLHKKKILLIRKIYNKIHKKEIALYKKEYDRLNKEKISLQRKKYYQDHKKETIEQDNVYKYNRYHRDINFRIRICLRQRLRKVLKKIHKSTSILKLIGCSLKELKQHLESQFLKNMSWSNYGLWHIDHIKPCASFDLRKKSEQRKCFHYTNLQPLWAVDNLKKGAK